MVTTTDRRTTLSRVTLVGDRRRIDMLLPAEEPVGELLPDVLRMLGDSTSRQPMLRRLVLADGTVLAQDDTLASAGVPDGAVVRLVREHETPAAPVVHDVTDETADDLDVRGWRWGARARAWTAGGATILLGLVAAVCACTWFGAGAVVPLTLCAAAAMVAGAPLARWGSREVGTVLVLLGGALGAFTAWTVSASAPEARLGAVGLAATVTLVVLGMCTSLGRGGLVGGGAVAIVGCCWELGWVLTDGSRVGVVLGVFSVLALGYLPRLALMGAGLTRLDDRHSGGASVSRHRVDLALAASHRGLALATVVIAVSAVLAGHTALETPTVWTVIGTALLAVVLFSRARAFPLAVEVVVLQAAAAVLVVRLLILWAGFGAGISTPTGSAAPAALPLLALAAGALLPLGALAVHPPDHVRVRLRRIVNLVEAFSVVALIPVAIGAFGVYGRLLNTF